MALNFLSTNLRDRFSRSHELGAVAGRYSWRESSLSSKLWITTNRALPHTRSNLSGTSNLVRQLARRVKPCFNDVEHPFQLFAAGDNTFGIRKGALVIPQFLTTDNTQRVIELQHAWLDPSSDPPFSADATITIDQPTLAGNPGGVYVYVKMVQHLDSPTTGTIPSVTVVVEDYITGSFFPYMNVHHTAANGDSTTYFPIGNINFINVDTSNPANLLITSWTFDQFPVTNSGGQPVEGTFRGIWGQSMVFWPGDICQGSDSKLYIWGINIDFDGGRLACGVNYDPTSGAGSGWLPLT